MFCPNCGKPLDDGVKFCPNCGTPAPEAPPVNEVPAAPEAPVAPEVTEAPAEAPQAPQAQPAELPKTVTFTASEDTLIMVLRVVCGVLGAIFAFFALKSAFSTISFLFRSVTGIPDALRGYYPFGITAYLLSFVLNLLLDLVALAAPLLAAAALLLAAVKWEKKHADLIFCGVAAAAVLRLVLLVLALPFNFLMGVFIYRVSLGFAAGFFTSSLLHVLGYVLAAGVVFGLMYLMGCAPVMGKTAEQVKENVRSSVRDISGKVQSAAANVASKAAAAENPTATAPATPAPAVTAYSRRMSTNRGLLMYILLNIVTCGIYSYIFIYGLANDVNEVCQGDGEKTGGLLAYILLNLVTCNIYYFIWWYKLGNRIAANGPRYNVTIQENGTTFLLWTLLGSLLCGLGPLIALHQVLRNLNTLCAAYNYKNGFTA